MEIEEFVNFWEWIGPAAFWFFIVLCACIVLGIVYGFLVSAARNGPAEAFYSVATVIAQAGPDLIKTSPRRIFALSKLAVQEAMRRRIIIVAFVIFAAMLLFGGWFLDVRSDSPHEIYLSIVLFGTQMLVVLLGLLISCFSLPQDIKNRTIYTVVTKPVRAFEIVVGRIIGFSLIGTVLILAMGLISYFFVVRGLSHSHQVDLSAFEFVDPVTGETPSGRRASINAVLEGRTTFNSHHSHRVEVIRLGNPGETAGEGVQYAMVVAPISGHGHALRVTGDRPDSLSEDGVFTFRDEDEFLEIPTILDQSGVTINTTQPQGYLQARVPIRASELSFLDRAGQPSPEGVNVGDEWQYRTFIDGGVSQARAIFKFEGIERDRFDESLEEIPLELTLGVFRTHKGRIERRVTGTITLRNEIDEIEYETDPIIFESQEFQVQTIGIPRTVNVQWTDENGTLQKKSMDLFDEFAPEGELEVWLRCNEGGQFFGVARADVYFRGKEAPFFTNFAKGYVGIWLQMLIVISLGVMFSTFVSGPIAMLGTIALMVIMSYPGFIHDVATQEIMGGGPIESTYRLIIQQNVTNELEAGVATTIVQSLDWFMMKMVDLVANSVPDFGKISTVDYLAKGYDIGGHKLATNIAITLAFCLVMSVIGYFRLKTREIAS